MSLQLAFEVTLLLGRNGGFDDLLQAPKAKRTSKKGDKRKLKEETAEDGQEEKEEDEPAQTSKRPKRSRK